MSKIKKLIALTLALAMVLSVSAFAGSYKADTYADAASINSDCKSAIELLYALDIMVGDGKNFNPESAVTRAEMAKMIYVILNYGDDDKAATYTGGKFFTDVEAGYWAEGYINYCAATKLIAGRGDNTFDPTAPVTTAEAAKMLLTAIGYSAEARGYTGANWDKNALSDASIIGLLKGYKSNVNTYAPRQWVAVMFENMLLDAYTFGTMAPTFSGLLVSGSDVDEDGDWNGYETMGQKYYGLNDKTGYLVSTQYAWLEDGVRTDANYKKALFVNGDNELIAAVSGTGLGLDDLGQQYRVIWGDDGVLSVRNTGKSVVGESTIKDITTEITYDTSDNRANNSYIFTIGELEGAFGKYEKVNGTKRDTIHYVAQDGGEYAILAAGALADWAGADCNDIVKAIDRDGDGDIDYAIITYYEYAEITKVSETRNGEFIEMIGPDWSEAAVKGAYPTFEITWNDAKETRLYLDDVIVADELEEGNFVKYFYDVEEDAYVLEVLEVVNNASYDKKTSKGVFTFDGEKYRFADYGFNTEARMDGVSYETEFDIVIDDGLLVYVGNIDNSYTEIDKINEQLAIVTAWKYLDRVYYSGGPEGGEELYQITYMTIDGEKHTAEYTLSAEYDEDEVLAKYETASKIAEWYNAGWRLFVLHTESDGSVWCEDPAKVDVHEDLNASADLLDAYVGQLNGVEINTARDTMKNVDALDGIRAEINPEMKLFVRYGANKYKVCTIADLADGVDADATVQVYYKNNSRKVPVVLAGYIDVQGLEGEDTYGYVYLTGDEDGDFAKASTSYNRYYADLTFEDGTTLEGAVVVLPGTTTPSETELYKFVYDIDNNRYNLTVVEPGTEVITALYKNSKEIEYGYENYETIGSKDVIVLSKFVIELDEAVLENADDEKLAEIVEEEYLINKEECFESIEFTTLADLPETVIEGKVEGDTYFYVSGTLFDAGDSNYEELVYVVQIKVQVEDQTGTVGGGNRPIN